jgi:hypothetical protein
MRRLGRRGRNRGSENFASLPLLFLKLKVSGRLDFSPTGILASLANPLAQAGISIFAVSTFDTDYLLVKDSSLEQALTALRQAGHETR